VTTWEQTSAGLLRGSRTPAARSLATVPGPDAIPRAEQYPDAAAEYRAAWSSNRWSFEAADGSAQFTDNAAVRAEQQRLAAEGPQVAWFDFPALGLPPDELKPLYAAAIAERARIGTKGPDGGEDQVWQQIVREHDYARTPWSGSVA